MGLSRFMVKKGKLNYKIPIILALHVHSIPPSFGLRQNKRKIKPTPFLPSVIKDVKVTLFSFFGGEFGREISLLHVVLSNIVDSIFNSFLAFLLLVFVEFSLLCVFEAIWRSLPSINLFLYLLYRCLKGPLISPLLDGPP